PIPRHPRPPLFPYTTLFRSCADGRFEVMPPLIRGVDAAKAGLDREPHAALRVVFFPGGAVEEGRDHRRHGNLPSFPQHRERGAPDRKSVVYGKKGELGWFRS